MKYMILYGRKVRVAAYDMLEISLSMEFDGAITSPENAFEIVKEKVDHWVQEDSDRLLEKSVPRAERGE